MSHYGPVVCLFYWAKAIHQGEQRCGGAFKIRIIRLKMWASLRISQKIYYASIQTEWRIMKLIFGESVLSERRYLPLQESN